VPPPGPYLPGFDALHYDIDIALPGDGGRIEAVTTLDVARSAPVRDTLRLDLSGLRVTRVLVGRPGDELSPAAHRQDDGRLFVTLPRSSAPDTVRVEVTYDGVPDDGLILRQNVRGEPSAFADNWPDRARFWFPSIDHPSDKATVAYEVRAPRGWKVIANGVREDTTDDESWSYRVDVPIPTYTMVIGATRMSVGAIDVCAPGGRTASRPDGCVAVTSWTFPQDSANGARIFRRGGDMVRYYAERFGPFPYDALAHVQSATRFGGMENVGAIFYSERAVANGSLSETTVAHETAHQWFGDAVTPADWPHLWLSEGFATYFGIQYFEDADGRERFRGMLDESANGYLQSDVQDLAIVDTLRIPDDNLFSLLNENSYQKGGQVLHMLRGLVGDDAFFQAVRRYFESQSDGSARTSDLQSAFEDVAGRDLSWFFEQWVYSPGHPVFRVSYEFDAAAGRATIVLEQTQSADWPTFRLPLELEITTARGSVRHRVEVTGRRTETSVQLDAAPVTVALDPDGWVLEERVDGQGATSR
jgi:aminopeptidase N